MTNGRRRATGAAPEQPDTALTPSTVEGTEPPPPPAEGEDSHDAAADYQHPADLSTQPLHAAALNGGTTSAPDSAPTVPLAAALTGAATAAVPIAADTAAERAELLALKQAKIVEARRANELLAQQVELQRHAQHGPLPALTTIAQALIYAPPGRDFKTFIPANDILAGWQRAMLNERRSFQNVLDSLGLAFVDAASKAWFSEIRKGITSWEQFEVAFRSHHDKDGSLTRQQNQHWTYMKQAAGESCSAYFTKFEAAAAMKRLFAYNEKDSAVLSAKLLDSLDERWAKKIMTTVALQNLHLSTTALTELVIPFNTLGDILKSEDYNPPAPPAAFSSCALEASSEYSSLFLSLSLDQISP